ncbi:MAG: methyltransferase regulatory domain-containing protein [Planctomycetaceae bacterium]|nr:methyltransferase regulatory domain-containing protein [Planctomycetaceae bacterium]MCB9952171.1 methyltransferase regulatory domain-containing protein [Planctomycetaceae bacterium]
MSETATNSYDRTPYRSLPFPQTHPSRLGTIGTLLGMSPAPLENARILELGCASGGNLLPMADQYQNATLIGIDGSALQIEDGNQALKAAGLTNVELRHQDILEFESPEPFDYIICHGVYSWVPDNVQSRILEIAKQSLAPNGLAYISYNTFPGWHMRGMIRDIMRFRASSFEDPDEQLAQARGLLTFLTNSIKSENNAYGLMLKNELESISRADDSYLIHEHLEEINSPIYFHQFAERLAEKGLQYVGEADFGVMSLDNFPDHVRGMLESVARSRIEVEQYMDFLRNRAFRQTILTHADVQLDNAADPTRLLKLRVSSNAQPDQQIDAKSQDKVGFRRRGSVLTTTEPVVKAAMQHLAKVWPQSVPFTELAATARSFVAGRPVPVDTEVMSDASRHLAKTLLRCFATSMIDLHLEQAPFVTRLAEMPVTSTLARAQAQRGASVSNRLHEHQQLDDIQRFVLQQLDGGTNAATLLERVTAAVTSGELLLFHPDGRKVEESEDLQAVLKDLLPHVVVSLAKRALIVS